MYIYYYVLTRYDIKTALNCAESIFPDDHKKTLAGLRAFAKYMIGEFHCYTRKTPTNDEIEMIIEEIVGYEVPDELDKAHLFMDVFFQFSINFINFGPG